MAASSQPLNVVGLISGGKDSFFSLLHCIANHHHLIALANLHPPAVSSPSVETEDLNSYMYQTAGHGIVPLYAKAIGLPLYRQEISGTAANSSRDYYLGPGIEQSDDETESLTPLLKKVLAVHPTVNAVCSGAILSTYQRTRIESIARRLDLTPLSYLWQYPSLGSSPPGRLLDDMAVMGFDVRIVKVASGGLHEDLLWCDLMKPDVRKRVERSLARFGGNVLGEGGEYETIVIDGPAQIWKGRIEVQDHERFIGRGEGGEAWIGFRPLAGKVEMKVGLKPTFNEDWKSLIRLIVLWDKEFDTLIAKATLSKERKITENKGVHLSYLQKPWEPRAVTIRYGSTLVLANITAVGSGYSAREQMLGIESRLVDILEKYTPCTANDIVFTTILLRFMTDFGTVNSIYERLFTLPNPPARVTVALGDALPEGVSLMVSFVLDLGPPLARDGLHVQSRSYWAPANIGPYSQAISVPLFNREDLSLVYVAGQIPLVPASMEVYHPGNIEKGQGFTPPDDTTFLGQACLSLQHLWRIGRAMNVGWWTGALAFITGAGDMQMKAETAWEVWQRLHEYELWTDKEEQEGVLDIWDRVHGGMGTLAKERAETHPLPDFARLSNSASFEAPGFLAVEVDQLPRGCDIEWQSLGIAYQDSVTSTIEMPISFLSIQSDQELRTKLLELLEATKPLGQAYATVYSPDASLISDLDVQIIPSRRVWGPKGVQLAGAIVLHNRSK